mmetsp:Transcript_22761/g.53103  ORF Transcript_22761/g.53103 Transcript_22761/m.53103 type:complete len:252 (-) Transcript_22761:7-762(-)
MLRCHGATFRSWRPLSEVAHVGAALRAAGSSRKHLASVATPQSASSSSSSRATLGSTTPLATWPGDSHVFEPVWDQHPMFRYFAHLPNSMETYLSMREAQKRMSKLRSADDFNMHFMDRFVEMHTAIEGRRRPVKQGPQSQGLVPVGYHLAASGAQKQWLGQRPRDASLWELTPHWCQVLQARRAKHNSLQWVQVTTMLSLEERWKKNNLMDMRVRQFHVVFELPAPLSELQGEAFRIVALRFDEEEEAKV